MFADAQGWKENALKMRRKFIPENGLLTQTKFKKKFLTKILEHL